ncbi:hypothetical protein EBM89_04540 [Cellulomonas triticagri]|uniref:Uncharacterized protein n=1 Tax=Cellulomonas triticagri TaxID=2483352 RepID=A0A3M2JT32_9CELL|nr:hypothetical protein EBM89_04540 [Cellulomonas triticagri]
MIAEVRVDQHEVVRPEEEHRRAAPPFALRCREVVRLDDADAQEGEEPHRSCVDVVVHASGCGPCTAT